MLTIVKYLNVYIRFNKQLTMYLPCFTCCKDISSIRDIIDNYSIIKRDKSKVISGFHPVKCNQYHFVIKGKPRD